MAWIESHVELSTHPKTFELMTALDIGKPEAVGLLTILWHFTLQFAWRDGDLSKFSDEAIASWVGWKGDAKTFIQALESTRWLDNKKVHDWLDYAGKLIKDRIYDQERRKRTESDGKRRNPTDSDGKLRNPPEILGSARKNAATVPYPTAPNRVTTTKDSPPNGAADSVPTRPEPETTENDGKRRETAESVVLPEEIRQNPAENGVQRRNPTESDGKRSNPPESEKIRRNPTDTTPFWHDAIDHMKISFARERNSALFIPGKILPQLKDLMRVYPAPQTMALWDVYLASKNDFAKQRGYSVEAFLQMITQLVDDLNYKTTARQYEDQLNNSMLPTNILKVLGEETPEKRRRRGF